MSHGIEISSSKRIDGKENESYLFHSHREIKCSLIIMCMKEVIESVMSNAAALIAAWNKTTWRRAYKPARGWKRQMRHLLMQFIIIQCTIIHINEKHWMRLVMGAMDRLSQTWKWTDAPNGKRPANSDHYKPCKIPLLTVSTHWKN